MQPPNTLLEPEDAGPEPDSPARTYLFRVLSCDAPLHGSARYCLTGTHEVVFARGPKLEATRTVEQGLARLTLDLPDARVSSKHCTVYRSGDDWVLEDRGSKNGSWINGVRTSRGVLVEGDEIQVGRTFFLFRTLESPAGSPEDAQPAPASGLLGMQTVLPALQQQLSIVAQLAPSMVPILLLGETGTGKEVLARAIHALSAKTGSFVAVNCGAIPPNLVESTLFGHTRGSFSGAVRDEPGLFRAADRGTLFLDEVADLPAAAQVALLRALQEQEVTPVGGTRPIRVNVRVLAATHRSVDSLTGTGELRLDLLARIAGCRHVLPPVRERREDLGLWVAALLERLAKDRASEITFSAKVGRAFLRYSWPLNVREIEHCLARALALAPSGAIDKTHLPPAVVDALKLPEPGQVSEAGGEMDSALREELLAQLAKNSGNVTRTAEAMGKARMQVQRWLRRWHIDASRFRS